MRKYIGNNTKNYSEKLDINRDNSKKSLLIELNRKQTKSYENGFELRNGWSLVINTLAHEYKWICNSIFI